MSTNFTKMHGLGNDFIIIDEETGLPDHAGEWAVKLCNRFFGVGADGLVYILPSQRADIMMRIINADGSEAEQCGNAIRCVAKHVYERGLVRRREIAVETIGAGVQKVELNVRDGKVSDVRVDMGKPVLEGLQVPTVIDRNPVVDHEIEVDGTKFRFTAVSMGNPHCVIHVEDTAQYDLHYWGPKLEKHPLFPNKVNVEFAAVKNRHYAQMRVWERGAGPTLACGTGACAVLVSAVLNGLTERSATVSLPGGELWIEWNEADDRVYMTGPAAEVYRGTLA